MIIQEKPTGNRQRLTTITVERPRRPASGGLKLPMCRTLADQGDGSALWCVRCPSGRRFTHRRPGPRRHRHHRALARRAVPSRPGRPPPRLLHAPRSPDGRCLRPGHAQTPRRPGGHRQARPRPRTPPHARRSTPRRRCRHRHHLPPARPCQHHHHRPLFRPPRAKSGHRSHAPSNLDGSVKTRCSRAVPHVTPTASAPSATCTKPRTSRRNGPTSTPPSAGPATPTRPTAPSRTGSRSKHGSARCATLNEQSRTTPHDDAALQRRVRLLRTGQRASWGGSCAFLGAPGTTRAPWTDLARSTAEHPRSHRCDRPECRSVPRVRDRVRFQNPPHRNQKKTGCFTTVVPTRHVSRPPTIVYRPFVVCGTMMLPPWIVTALSVARWFIERSGSTRRSRSFTSIQNRSFVPGSPRSST